ncbi:diguanylate phosphodiesterase metal dependent hydrolase domain protein [Thiorhodococcus drewsii AZ1]|uniref:Diguanylate phosphodiesterase metal dependent hydrolase domain protein n=1 Tax=Thiorhodococcus drewsii AZ1 TaxID=765913 RepID=G2DXH3_9GAMM|nr:HDOD domain-containing protein [Thiorhodococcus drewsii]EGV33022.1 diguanylate phosphodiesterase metal dependent hydrolase domain protein [Thiorhodococcus drewsii AZ1]
MTNIFLGVQPIFDRERQVVAYELLFRSSGTGGFEGSGVDGDCATSQVILNAFADIGVDQLGRDKQLYINLTAGMLASDVIQTLPPDRVVLEILESVQVTPELIESVQRLVDKGFTIALDDFMFQSSWEPLLRICHIVKLDVLGDDEDAMRVKYESVARRGGLKLLAEKVENRIQFVQCLNMGFDLFQGYYLARPRVMEGKRPPADKIRVMRLLAELQDNDLSLQEVERLIAQDVALSYRLLRFLSGASISQGRTIHNLMQAISLVGLRTIRQWAALVALGTLTTQTPYSITRSLAYARFCQIVGERNLPREKDALFTVGLFSNLDEILEVPLGEALASLPLDEAIKAAILSHEGLLGQVLASAARFEGWDASGPILPTLGLSGEVLSTYFLEAFAWAQGVQAQLAAPLSKA